AAHLGAARAGNPFPSPVEGGFLMEPRKDERREPKAAETRKPEKPKFRVVKLEERIAPKLATNHNEALVRDPAKPKTAEVRKEDPKPKLRVVKLEERIAPG